MPTAALSLRTAVAASLRAAPVIGVVRSGSAEAAAEQARTFFGIGAPLVGADEMDSVRRIRRALELSREGVTP